MLSNMLKINDYMKISEAAKFLGVSINTLRKWDKAGKCKAYRSPMNNYRYYREKDLVKILKELSSTKR